MNAKRLFLISLVLLCVLAPGAIAQGNYIPKENEELYGTWTNKENLGDHYHPQKLVVTPGGYADYSKSSDSVPRFNWRLKIDSKWTDSDGNIWYKVLGMGTSYYEGEKFQELLKLSESGTVMERAINIPLVEYDPANYPKEIDSHAFSYRILFRSEA
jgi:hypothetical protein